jgi:Tfp pilus assembly protein PilF
MVALAIGALSACSTAPGQRIQSLFQPSKGSAALSTGLKQYEDGDYLNASKNLQGAIAQGVADRDRANAHKHLAFIDCASGRERQCRDQFRIALAIDPGLELAPAEAGHPVWGPIFKSLKAGR